MRRRGGGGPGCRARPTCQVSRQRASALIALLPDRPATAPPRRPRELQWEPGATRHVTTGP